MGSPLGNQLRRDQRKRDARAKAGHGQGTIRSHPSDAANGVLSKQQDADGVNSGSAPAQFLPPNHTSRLKPHLQILLRTPSGFQKTSYPPRR